MAISRIIIAILLFFIISPTAIVAKITAPAYAAGIYIDSVVIKHKTAFVYDSMMKHHSAIANKKIIFSVMPRHHYIDKTVDFYLLLGLFLVLGIVRFSDLKYFFTLGQSFKSSLLSGKQMKEKLENAALQNMLMNIFFIFSLGAWLYYTLNTISWNYSRYISPIKLISLLSLGVLVVYTCKYAVIRYSGWAFRVQHITDHYLFNVFFINKVLAICLLPFTILMAFGTAEVASMGSLLSILLVILLFAIRYIRSWQVFGAFFQYSKFHFFMYLCASELLPLAVLIKLIMLGLS